MERDIEEHGLEKYNRFYGTYRGEVAANDDPEHRGRLQLKVPSVYGKDTYERWALPKGLYSGKGIGAYFIPNVKDPVWVSFENGDPRFPIWEYGWWTKDSTPEGSTNKVNVIQTTSGNRIELNDSEELIRITDSNDNVIEMNSNGVSVKSSKVSLGSIDGSDEPSVLGDTAEELLKELISDIGNIAGISVPNGVSGSISSSPTWATLVSKWDVKFKDFKSKKVTLD